MDKYYDSICQAIGRTPMVEMSRICALSNVEGRLFGKLEYLNPGFSKKDRIALGIVILAKEKGELAPGQTVVELTSGNTGTGLSIVCAAMGHPFVAVMSRGNSTERARMMRALGAEVVLVDQAKGSVPGQVSGEDLALVEMEAQRLTRELGAFRADQFNHIGNTIAHEQTGREILEQMDGDVDVFLDFGGTGGSFVGVARALRAQKHDVRCYYVEPASARYLKTGAVQNASHRIQGGGYSMDLPLLEPELVTDYVGVTDEEAIEMARLLAKTEGIFAGFSSGANVAAALSLLRGPERGSRVALLINDSGLKYLSTDLYEE